MYGHPSVGFMPRYRPRKKRGRPSFLSLFLKKQADLFPYELALERGKLSLMGAL